MKNLKHVVFSLAILLAANAAPLFGQWIGPINVFTTEYAQNPVVGVDADGNAVVMATASDDNVTYYQKGAQLVQGAVQNLQNFPSIGSNPMSGEFIPYIAVNASGNAAALWTENDPIALADFVRAVVLTDNVWGNPTTLTDPDTDGVLSFSLLGVTLDNANSAIGGWIGQNGLALEARQYVAPNWSGVEEIPVLSDSPANMVLVGTPTGQALIEWVSYAPYLYASYYNGTSWNTQQVSQDVFNTCHPLIAASMNVNNIAMMIWNNASTSGISSVLVSAGVVENIQAFYTPAGDESINALAVAIDNLGNAISVWISQIGASTYKVKASRYSGGIWGTPLILDTANSGNTFANPNVAVDGQGNAYVVYEKDDISENGTIYYNQYTVANNGWLSASVLLSTPGVLTSNNPKLSMNSFGEAAVVWSIDPIMQQSIQIVYTGNLSPSHLTGNQVKNKFLTQTDIINEIRWTASPSSSTVSYNIFRNGKFIGTVLATAPLVYKDHNRRKNVSYIYEVTAVNAQGLQSVPISVVVP